MISYAWYGSTVTNCRLAARCDADGDVTLTLSDGRQLIETAATATNDGVVLFEFDLPAATTGTLTQNGEQYQYTMHIKPLPTDRLRVVHWSCGNFRPQQFLGLSMIEAYNPDLVICLGDFTYPDLWGGLDGLHGETCVETKKVNIIATGEDAYRPHYRQLMKDPSFKSLHSKTPLWYMWDDHEVLDNWCWGINNANKFYYMEGEPIQATTDAEVRQIYDIARNVFENEVACVNPRNTDSGIDTDPAALYFRQRVGDLVEFFVTDGVSHKDLMTVLWDEDWTEVRPVKSRTDPTKTLLGTTQKTWMKNGVTQAEADGVAHKVIGYTKQMYHNLEGVGAQNNTDTFAMEYRAERDELVEFCAGISSLVCLQHDNHEPAIYKNETHGFLGVNACSLSSGTHNQGPGYAEHVAWKCWNKGGGYPDSELLPPEYPKWAFGLIDIDPQKQVHSMIEPRTGKAIWGPWPVYAGGSAVDQLAVKTA